MYKYKGGGEFPEYTGMETREALEVRAGAVFVVVRNYHTGAELSATKHPNQGWAECRELLKKASEEAKAAELFRMEALGEKLLTKAQAVQSRWRYIAVNNPSCNGEVAVVKSGEWGASIKTSKSFEEIARFPTSHFTVEEQADELVEVITALKAIGVEVSIL